MTKVKGLRPCKISKNSEGYSFSYTFEKDEVKDVPSEEVNVLVNTGYVEKVKEEKSK